MFGSRRTCPPSHDLAPSPHVDSRSYDRAAGDAEQHGRAWRSLAMLGGEVRADGILTIAAGIHACAVRSVVNAA